MPMRLLIRRGSNSHTSSKWQTNINVLLWLFSRWLLPQNIVQLSGCGLWQPSNFVRHTNCSGQMANVKGETRTFPSNWLMLRTSIRKSRMMIMHIYKLDNYIRNYTSWQRYLRGFWEPPRRLSVRSLMLQAPSCCPQVSNHKNKK